MKSRLLLIGIALLSLAIGSYLGLAKFRTQQATTPSTLADIAFPDVEKNLRNGNEWLGKVVVVNHWATWCPPCRKEIPIFIEYQTLMADKGVQLVGIAHDQLENTLIFGDQIGINYPSLVAIVGGGELLQKQGNTQGGALPFTAIYDRSGTLVKTHLGEMHWQDLHDAVDPLL